jgi:hypothetical protein
MTSEDTNLKKRPVTKVIYQFLMGALLGAFVIIIIPTYSYGSFADLNLVQVGFASLLVVSFGMLSSIWGEKFIDAVMRTIESFGS